MMGLRNCQNYWKSYENSLFSTAELKKIWREILKEEGRVEEMGNNDASQERLNLMYSIVQDNHYHL